MIPLILAAAGGYLIGNAPKSTKFAAGGTADDGRFVEELTENDVSIYGFMAASEVYSELDLQIEYKKFKVYFDLLPDIKSYGYRGIQFILTRIAGSFDWSVNEDEYEELSEADKQTIINMEGTEGYIVLDINPDSTEWKINTDELKFSPSGSFMVSEIEINFKKKEIELK
jgi:hypothetical protein